MVAHLLDNVLQEGEHFNPIQISSIKFYLYSAFHNAHCSNAALHERIRKTENTVKVTQYSAWCSWNKKDQYNRATLTEYTESLSLSNTAAVALLDPF